VVSENAGVVNIGLEGMMTLGAFIGAAIGFYAGDAWIGFIAAGIAGGILALFHAVACVSFAANHVVSGIAINFLGPGISLFFSKLLFDGATMTKPLLLEDKIPRPFNGLFAQNSFFDLIVNQYATVYIAFILVAVVWFLLYKTRLGLRIRSVGEHPKAADTLGINVFKVKYIAVIVSGILAGLGGAAMSVAVVSNFRPTLISGQGFIALAAMIFGKWKPHGAMAACLLFGFAEGLVVFLGAKDIPVASQIWAMLPYVITLVILISVVGKSEAPSADGIPYEK
jgi:simple sugar transport system permease protein